VGDGAVAVGVAVREEAAELERHGQRGGRRGGRALRRGEPLVSAVVVRNKLKENEKSN